MPIEIKELLIRAFVADPESKTSNAEAPQEKEANSVQEILSVVTNMLKQEKER